MNALRQTKLTSDRIRQDENMQPYLVLLVHTPPPSVLLEQETKFG